MNIVPQDATPQKYCPACLEWKPATREYFHVQTGRSDGFRNPCKMCLKAGRKFRIPIAPEGFKQCTKCKTVHPATTEFFSTHSRGGLHPRCRKCLSEQAKKRYPDRAEKIRRYYQENHEKIRIKRKQYYQFHTEKMRERRQRYFKTERGRMVSRIAFHIRRSRKREVEGKISSQQIQEKLKAQKYACYYCLNKFKKRANGSYIYHLDHTVPVSRSEYGPRNDVNYIVLACPSCNLSKKDKLPHEWPEGGRLF